MRVPAILAFPPQTPLDFLIGERRIGALDCDFPLAFWLALVENPQPDAISFLAPIATPSVRTIGD